MITRKHISMLRLALCKAKNAGEGDETAEIQFRWTFFILTDLSQGHSADRINISPRCLLSLSLQRSMCVKAQKTSRSAWLRTALSTLSRPHYCELHLSEGTKHCHKYKNNITGLNNIASMKKQERNCVKVIQRDSKNVLKLNDQGCIAEQQRDMTCLECFMKTGKLFHFNEHLP